MTDEIWKDIPRYEGYYQVSNLGRVKSLRRKVRNKQGFCYKRERILKPAQLKQSGHLYVNLCKDCECKPFKVHFLVLLSFVGPRPEGMESRHFPDRNPTNNCLENLSYATKTQNQRDRKKHGTGADRQPREWVNGLYVFTKAKNKGWKRQ